MTYLVEGSFWRLAYLTAVLCITLQTDTATNEYLYILTLAWPLTYGPLRWRDKNVMVSLIPGLSTVGSKDYKRKHENLYYWSFINVESVSFSCTIFNRTETICFTLCGGQIRVSYHICIYTYIFAWFFWVYTQISCAQYSAMTAWLKKNSPRNLLWFVYIYCIYTYIYMYIYIYLYT